jgi:hypothetical protein
VRPESPEEDEEDEPLLDALDRLDEPTSWAVRPASLLSLGRVRSCAKRTGSTVSGWLGGLGSPDVLGTLAGAETWEAIA